MAALDNFRRTYEQIQIQHYQLATKFILISTRTITEQANSLLSFDVIIQTKKILKKSNKQEIVDVIILSIILLILIFMLINQSFMSIAMAESEGLLDQNIYTFRNKVSSIEKAALQDKQNQLNKQATRMQQQIRPQKIFNENHSIFSKRQFRPMHRPSIALKGKNLLQKCNIKQSSFRLIKHDFSSLNHQSEMPRVQRGSKMLRYFKKIKTETKLASQINELNICPMILQKEFIAQQTPEPNSCILNFTTVRPAFQNLQRKSLSLKRQYEANHPFQQKISQSRGLQLFAKLYVRNKFELIEKPKEKRSFCKPSQTLQEIKQNLDIRKISPLEKVKKKKLTNDRYDERRTSIKNYCAKSNRQNNYKQFYQLSGWQNAS